MLHDEYDFQGQLRYEKSQFFFRRHWARFLLIIFFGLVVGLLVFITLMGLIGLMTYVDLGFMRAFFAFTILIIAIVYWQIFFLQIINYYFDLVIVTDCRVIIIRKTVFLRNNSDAIDLTKIQDIAVESHGLLRNYLGYGKLVITLSTSAPPITIIYVPKPHFYLERTNRVKREHILIRRQGHQRAPESQPASPTNYLQDVRQL